MTSIKNLLLAIAISTFIYTFLSSTKQLQTKWYNEDLLEVFGVQYLPFSIDDPDDPRVSKILDAHDISTDVKYLKYNKRNRFDDWASILAQGPTPNDKRVYIAEAGKKGYGLYAGKVLKAGEFLSVFTGIYVLKDRGLESTYKWGYESKPLNENGDEVYFNTDGRLSGNLLRFINDDPGGPERNCRTMKVWV
jgi:hypothetical protein